MTPAARPWGSVVLGSASVFAGVALTATSGWLVVRASERPVILTLLTAVVAVRAFGLARPVLRYAERLRSHDRALATLAEARAEVARSLVPLTPARLGRRRRSDVLGGVVDDLTEVVEDPVRATVPTATALLTLVVVTGLTALVEPMAALVHLALLGAVALVVGLALRVERRGQGRLGDARAEITRVAELLDTRLVDVVAIGAEDDARRWLDEAQRALARETSRQARGRALVAAAVPALLGLAAGAIAWVAAGSDLAGPLRALLVLTPLALADALTPLADAARARARADAAAARLARLLDQAPAVLDVAARPAGGTPGGRAADRRPGERPAPQLRLRGVTASWDGSAPALGPVDLELAPGSRTRVTGTNGCGKSTLLAVLARQLDPSAGSVLLDGVDVRTLPLESVRRLVAVVDDEPWVLATSLRENLRIARPQPDPFAGDALDDLLVAGLGRAGLRPWYAALPDGLDTRLGAGGSGVSGGERTRLALARAVVSQRPVLLLDEPVAHLDAPTAAAVLGDLVDVGAGRTLVVVSHDDLPAGVVDATVSLAAPHRAGTGATDVGSAPASGGG